VKENTLSIKVPRTICWQSPPGRCIQTCNEAACGLVAVRRTAQYSAPAGIVHEEGEAVKVHDWRVRVRHRLINRMRGVTSPFRQSGRKACALKNRYHSSTAGQGRFGFKQRQRRQ